MPRKPTKRSVRRDTSQKPKSTPKPKERFHRELERANLLMGLFTKAPSLNDKQLFDYALDIAVHITDSQVGFFHQVSADQKEFILTTWNRTAMEGCTTVTENHYPVESAGNWADCVRQRRPVIYNHFSRLPNRKGLPKGHFPLTRFASVPVLDGEKVRYVFGVGNKKTPYIEGDLVHLQLVANVMQEIVAQRRSKLSADESEERLRSFFSTMSDMVAFHEVVYDAAGKAVDYRILDCNPAFTISTGIPREKAVGTLASELYGTGKPPYFDHYLRAVESGRTSSFETYFEPLRKHYDVTTLPLGPGKFATITADVSDRKKAEGAVLESEEKYRQVVENALEIILVAQDGVLKFANESAVRRLGYTRDEIRRRPFTDFIHPNDRLLVVGRHQQRLNGGNPKNEYPFRIVNREGKTRWVEISSVLIQWEGGPATLNFMTDITERVAAAEALAKSEEKFSKAFYNSPVGLILASLDDGKILDINDTILEISGYGRGELIGRRTFEVGFWPDLQERRSVLGKLSSERRIRDYGMELRTKTGEKRFCRYSAELLEIAGERFVISTLLDVTQHRKDEETIQELLRRVEHDNEELRKIDRLKNDFIGIVSHDLRTPLTSINGYLRLLQDPRLGNLDSQQAEFVDLALKNARRLKNLIANFLDLTVMESGELKLKVRETPIRNVVLEVVKAMQNLAGAKLIRLLTDLPEPGPVLAFDPDKLEQVFINLVGNALKFTPPEGTITIGARLDEREGRSGLLAWVKDDGPGIPDEELGRIFDKFYQVDNPATRMVPGTGLGLNICQRIVEAHGGKIWAESLEGKGASFLFFIPQS